MDNVYKLKKEYSASGVPTAIADEKLEILWKNSIDICIGGSEIFEVGESADDIFYGGRPYTGLISKEINGELCTFNVIKVSDSGSSCYIIELIASRSPKGIVSETTVRGYIGYICSRIRTAVREITSVTDRLFDDISAGSLNRSRAAEEFDRIYESVAALESEASYPERIYSLIDPEKPDDIIILDKEMTAVVSGIKSLLHSKPGSGVCGGVIGCIAGAAADRVRIIEDYDRDIFFRMNADLFETAVASMTAECCGGGRYPERMIFSARRSGRDRAEVTVMSLDVADRTGYAEASHIRGTRGGFDIRLFAEYIYDVLGIKNGARFTKENIHGGLICKMNIETMPRGASVFAGRLVDGSGRRRGIAEKLAFFLGNISAGSSGRYTSENRDKASEKDNGI